MESTIKSLLLEYSTRLLTNFQRICTHIPSEFSNSALGTSHMLTMNVIKTFMNIIIIMD